MENSTRTSWHNHLNLLHHHFVADGIHARTFFEKGSKSLIYGTMASLSPVDNLLVYQKLETLHRPRERDECYCDRDCLLPSESKGWHATEMNCRERQCMPRIDRSSKLRRSIHDGARYRCYVPLSHCFRGVSIRMQRVLFRRIHKKLDGDRKPPLT
jgi:hypothetical protein